MGFLTLFISAFSAVSAVIRIRPASCRTPQTVSSVNHRPSPTNLTILPLTSVTVGCSPASASAQRSTNRL